MHMTFTKMHGLGNDFVVSDGRPWGGSLTPEQARYLAHRRLGVGCDQVLVLEAPPAGADFGLRIYNSDGTEAEQCGNGVRCVVVFLHRNGLTSKSQLVLGTRAGLVRCHLGGPDKVTVDMGAPRLCPERVPIVAEHRAPSYALQVGSECHLIDAVSMGNPHAVLRVEDVTAAPVATLGPAIQGHERFPQGANVGFMQVIDPAHIRLRVFERGAGETLACGSGACAAVVVGRRQGWLAERVAVDLPGGRLQVQWSGEEGQPVWMSGPVSWVFEGTIEVSDQP
jgi:diaminopimelate epimerase